MEACCYHWGAGERGKARRKRRKNWKGGIEEALTLLEKTFITIEFACKIFSVHYCDWSLIFG